jgi:carboxymethylenebutenolidase
VKDMARTMLIKDTLPAYYTYPEGEAKVPGIILIHEIWGLVDHIRDVANRFRSIGYAVLAPDLFMGMDFVGKVDPPLLKELADPATRDEAQKKFRAILAPTRSPEFSTETLDKLQACFDFLALDQRTNGRIAVVGFCFGGTFSFALATKEPRLKAAVPFYGRAPEPLEGVARIQCPVLAFYGERDTALVEPLPLLVEAMRENGKNFEHVVYPRTGHAFFNDTNANMYNKDAAEDAWRKTSQFLRKHLGA